ncbi:cyanate hydratase-like protein [Dinothrombium tinctorium]|uniref:Cyanate hydratase n=1 Tax=Dinothrombium tinctorium TaxID=1965070 RepID=A0A443QA97_9ACAR|nr:cyanate hydratase-like protein [Dinothrombium tinctorium]
MSSVLSRKAVTELLLRVKRQKRLNFEDIAKKLNKNKVWTTAAILGQHPMSECEANTVLDIFGIDSTNNEQYEEIKNLLMEIPTRGNQPWPPTDPTIYRLYELMQVYGPSIKALAHEQCGDGIISGINCELDMNKKSIENEDWVEIKILGKFLRYPK